MMDCTGEQKLLSELRVTELKQELEKRNLDKNGIKIILTDRLEKALLADGHDPATYLFRVNEPVVPSSGAKSMSPSHNTSMDTADAESNLHISENGNDAAAGDNEEKMETDAPPATNGHDETEKTDELNDSRGLIIADEQITAAARNDEEMLEDPLVDVPAETAPTPAKSAVNNITAQSSVKTPVQAPVSDDKEKDVASRSIWVRGLTSATKAADLKVLCTQYGKVVRAKIYTSKKQSTSACYGYVTMADTAAAEKAAAAMHKTQIKGRTISVEKADKSKVPAVKSAASTVAPAKKDGATSESTAAPAKRVAEKKSKDEDSKTKAMTEKSQSDAKAKSTSSSTPSKREEIRSSDRKREDKEKRTSNNDRRDSERPSRSSDGKRDATRRPIARDPRRGSQRTINAARRFPTRGISSYSLRGRITRPGDRGGYVSSIRRPEAMSQRDLLTMLRHKEEEHRRREAEIEKERALERERERIRFEREQLEKERLQLQLQAALQQQKMAAMSSSRTKDSYAPSSRGIRHSEYRSSRDGRSEKVSSSTSHHRSTGDSRRSAHESRSRHVGSGDRSSSRADRDKSEHKSAPASSRERSRHESYNTSSRSRPASYATGKDYDRGYASTRGTHSFSSGRGSSSYYGNSRDAYSSATKTASNWGTSSGPTYGSSSAWESSGGSALGGHSGSASGWSGRGTTGGGGWTAFGSSGTSAGVRYDYDKYQQRF